MAKYVNDLPDDDPQQGVSAHDAANVGLAGELKSEGLVTDSKPAREVNLPRPPGVVMATFLMLMAATWAWPAIFLIAAAEIPPTWVVLSMGVTTLLGIVAAIAMFMLRKWSVLLYALTTFIVAALIVAVRPEASWLMLGDLIVLGIAFMQLKHLE